MPGLQSDGRRRVAHSADILPANSSPTWPLAAAVQLRPYRRQPAVVRSPQFHPATAATTNYSLIPTVRLRDRKPYRAAVQSPRFHPSTPVVTYSLLPSVQLRACRFNRGQAPAGRLLKPPVSIRVTRPVASLRPARRNPAAVYPARLLYSSAPPTLYTYFIDPRKASVIRTDADPFGCDPRQARVTT